jgi:hypothetical protein
MVQTKVCGKCSLEKPISSFDSNKRGTLGLQSYCKVCSKQYRDKNKNPLKSREQHLVRTFGLSLSDFNIMLDSQKGVCAICHTAPASVPLNVDHCHTTGKVRGLLCGNCNRSLGLMKDNADRLRAAANYLERFNETNL